MIAIEYVVLFILMAVVLFAAVYFTLGIPWGNPGGYAEIMSCCSRYRVNDCVDTNVLCNGSTLRELLTGQNITEAQVKDMCNCGTK